VRRIAASCGITQRAPTRNAPSILPAASNWRTRCSESLCARANSADERSGGIR